MIKVELKKNKACPAKLVTRETSVKWVERSGGFTLLEALVAISILMMAVAAPITIAQRGLSSSIYSKNQMVASYLAQDAIEYIKNVRDQVAINSNNSDWSGVWTYLGASSTQNLCFSTDGCKVDTLKKVTDGSITAYTAGEYLRKDSITGLYSYDSGDQATDYTRKIKITMGTDDHIDTDDALITATVSWKGGNEVVVKTLMYNY